ncbi:MAG: hypothetical protein CMP11_05130 [Zetaproteobacteria bacterium]|nr:hypothetical protein [Pseudobdellovibrionaceae bacterium]|tara:strand:- start:1412 stop:2044 length:633 start_codon:yes stop_codon:yes gene_type:complete
MLNLFSPKNFLVTSNFVLVLLTSYFISSCQSSHKVHSKKKVFSHLNYKLPKKWSNSDSKVLENIIEVPKNLLNIASVKSNHTTLRKTPNFKSRVGNYLLNEGDELILFERFSFWQKVFIIKNQSMGWLHKNSLVRRKYLKGTVSIPSHFIPFVFAKKNIDWIYDYSGEEKVSFYIPKGSLLLKLKENKKKYLVIFPGSNSLASIDKSYFN